VEVWVCCVGVCGCGCVEVWVCGGVGVWRCGCVRGCVEVWVCAWVCGGVGVCVGVWRCGCVEVWVCGGVGVLRVGSGDRRRWEASAHAAHLTATAALPVHAAMAQNICSTHAQKLQRGAGRARQTPTGAQVGCGRERELRKLRARGAWPCERKSRSNACMVEVIGERETGDSSVGRGLERGNVARQ
jgi:hypothetical protein